MAKQICNLEQQQGFNIKFSIYFGLVWNEMQSYFPLKQMPADDVFGELCSLSYQPMFIGILIWATLYVSFHNCGKIVHNNFFLIWHTIMSPIVKNIIHGNLVHAANGSGDNT